MYAREYVFKFCSSLFPSVRVRVDDPRQVRGMGVRATIMSRFAVLAAVAIGLLCGSAGYEGSGE